MFPVLVVVFDTNVLIPLLLPASRSTRLFSRLRGARWQVAVTPQILDEVREKLLTSVSLRKWLRLSDHDIQLFLQFLPDLLLVVPGNIVVTGAVR